MNDARQHRQPFEIVELTGFAPGALLDPWMEQHSLTHSDKRTALMGLDRRSPSILAFTGHSTAGDFVRTYGGSLMRIEDPEAEWN